jgi:hypothetical protein
MAYTDLFNEAIDDLSATLATISGLRVVTDPAKINPPCVFLDAPSWESWNGNIVKMTFQARVFSLGPSNLDALRDILAICAKLLAKNVAVMDGRPVSIQIGGQEFPAYDLTIPLQAQAG